MQQPTNPLLIPGSAVDTVDRLNLFLFYGYRIDPEDQRRTLDFFRRLCGSPGAYRGLFGFTGDEPEIMRFFTGEQCEDGCRAQLSHEISVCLKKMRPFGSGPLIGIIDEALGEALAAGEADGDGCPESTLALWRNLSAAPFPGREKVLEDAVARLRAVRSDNDRWEGWPFYYTLLVLSEMPGDIARDELVHAVPSCRRAIARLRSGPQAKRRHDLLMRVLAQYGEGEITA